MISLSYQHLKKREGILSRKPAKEGKESKDGHSGAPKKRPSHKSSSIPSSTTNASGPPPVTSANEAAPTRPRKTATDPLSGAKLEKAIAPGVPKDVDATKKTFQDDATVVEKILQLKNGGADEKRRPQSARTASSTTKICDGSLVAGLQLKATSD